MKLRRLVFTIFFLLFFIASYAQQNFFVYLQTENGQPFYVKNGSQIMSSSTVGYLIIPQLTNGTYNFHVGFPKSEAPEENFEINVNKNAGFLIKNFGERGYALFDLQTLGLVMAKAKSNEEGPKEIQSDPFSSMLAKVVQDSSILEKRIQVPPVNSTTAVKPNADSDTSNAGVMIGPDTSALVSSIGASSILDDQQEKNEAIRTDKSDSIISSEPANNLPIVILEADTLLSNNLEAELASQHIRRSMRIRTMEGLEMVYIDSSTLGIDTVRLFMPVSTTIVSGKPLVGEHSPDPGTEEPATKSAVQEVEDLGTDSLKNTMTVSPAEKSVIGPDTMAMVTPIIPADESPGIQPEPSNTESKPDSTILVTEAEVRMNDTNTSLPKIVKSSSINSDCRSFADHEDFLKLRKKMAAENSKDRMLKVARKILETRCFSTEQIKNLSFLFLTDQGKYEFYDAAYPFTADSNEYYSLQSQLTDPYYINRFNAMINK